MIDLFLDDVRAPPVDGWTVVRSVEAAMEVLRTNEVGRCSLDHDMGECSDCANAFPPRGYRLVTSTCRHRLNGYNLVEWMAETKTWPRERPVVHSENEDGKAKMLALIAKHWTSPER